MTACPASPPASRSTRSTQARSSSSLKTLSRLSIRSRWSTGANSVEKVPPTVWVGESGVRRPGVLGFERLELGISSSYSPSQTVGASRT